MTGATGGSAGGSNGYPSRLAFLLAAGATVTAICLSFLAGWQRGGELPERLVWIAMGVVLVVSAHLLPALVRTAPVAVRGVASVLWVACMATACYGHTIFFLLAQRHAGELRAASITRIASPPSGRSLTVIMLDRANVTAQLATTNARRCSGDCRTLEGRRVSLAAKLDALNAEADQVRRRQADDDRGTARRDALLADPVTSRLASLLGTTASRVDLLSALAFAAVLEGLACLLWTVALGSRLAAQGPGPVTNPVTRSHEVDVPSHDSSSISHAVAPEAAPPVPVIASNDSELTRLGRDIVAGLVRPTVADIRRHLGCSQERAAKLRRQLAGANPPS